MWLDYLAAVNGSPRRISGLTNEKRKQAGEVG
jgi:hypothetical protein